jgi:hypothetical protein
VKPEERPIKVGDKVVHVNLPGEGTVLATNGNLAWVKYHGYSVPFTLALVELNIVPPKPCGWRNLYSGTQNSYLYPTREEADRNTNGRIALLVTFTDGTKRLYPSESLLP